MTKQEAWERFQEEVLPIIERTEQRQSGRKDRPLRAEEWNNFTDSLCKDGQITLKQYESWTHPRGLGS